MNGTTNIYPAINAAMEDIKQAKRSLCKKGLDYSIDNLTDVIQTTFIKNHIVIRAEIIDTSYYSKAPDGADTSLKAKFCFIADDGSELCFTMDLRGKVNDSNDFDATLYRAEKNVLRILFCLPFEKRAKKHVGNDEYALLCGKLWNILHTKHKNKNIFSNEEIVKNKNIAAESKNAVNSIQIIKQMINNFNTILRTRISSLEGQN
jgi:hypothetical protein